MLVASVVSYLKAMWTLETLGPKTARFCRLCANTIVGREHAYIAKSYGTLNGVGKHDAICVKCALAGVDGVAAVEGTNQIEIPEKK